MSASLLLFGEPALMAEIELAELNRRKLWRRRGRANPLRLALLLLFGELNATLRQWAQFAEVGGTKRRRLSGHVEAFQ